MKEIRTVTLLMWTPLLMTATGCDSRDQRLVDLSERSADRQKKQNEIIGRQSQAMTQENQRITEAYQELIQAQKELHQELHAEQESKGFHDLLNQSRIGGISNWCPTLSIRKPHFYPKNASRYVIFHREAFSFLSHVPIQGAQPE